MTDQFWLTILSSSLISGIIAAVIAGVFSLRGKQSEYVNDYFKTIVVRRLEAYESLEQLINSLKLSVLDDDHQLYHQVFSNEAAWKDIYRRLLVATAHPLWLSNEVFAKTRELNIMLLQASTHNRDLVEFGKSNYAPIAELRDQIEKLHAKDMLTLHDVKCFLKKKKTSQGSFEPIDVRGG
ncbi:hypothetical protein ICHIJ1_13940 [Fluviibacter phosphoraccumulans]|uniref:hypothetical protein n=1 Tax=Fluviibacter phosphoraccumulans TaxID=1751046 RepID=UPI0013676FF9|nr:hypothetical protein [Fluviibacter phosphoraccumulans]BBU71475.1 hypothetical protein ICHIJ1_13940 [Fluviibacter phosphoraccumulans]